MKREFILHFSKSLNDTQREKLNKWLLNLNQNFFYSSSICTEKQYDFARKLENILLEVGKENDTLLMNVLEKTLL